MTHATDTNTAIIPTEVPRTAAAHLTRDGEPITVVWSTIPVACIDWLLGDVTSQGPVHYGPDRVPGVWKSSNSSYCDWQAITKVQCGTCAQMVGPWALVRDGHLTDDELTDLANEVAELANDEYEYQRGKLIASLTIDAEDTVRHLAEGTLTRDEVPDLTLMTTAGVGIDGNEVVAWAFMPRSDNFDGIVDDIVEVARPIPTSDEPGQN